MTVAELRTAIAPALREILTSEELAATTVRVACWVAPLEGPPDEAWLTDADEVGTDTMIVVTTLGETQGLWVDGSESPSELHERVRSDLQDFVAESRFGWGQLRP